MKRVFKELAEFNYMLDMPSSQGPVLFVDEENGAD